VDLNPRFRFEGFVVGSSNRLAATAARAVAESPGAAYNPLFLYGKSGLGKTHLLQAVGFLALERQATLRVEYVTLEEFVERLHASVAAGQVEAFRRSLLETDLLLLDDVQFLAEHRQMQAELLRLAEGLQAAGRQLVLACDRAPSEIGSLDERLVSRLSGGLLVDIVAPDVETRLAILRRKALERGAAMPSGVLETVAELSASNVRELVGMVNRLIAFQAVSEALLTAEGVRALLADELGVGATDAAAAGAAEAPPAAEAEAPPMEEVEAPPVAEAEGPPLEEVEAPPAPEAEAPPVAEAEAPPAAPAAAGSGEYLAFVTSVSRSVAQTVEAWRSRIGEAALRWEGEGFRTRRLEQLLVSDAVPDVAAELAGFEARVEELRRLAEAVSAFDPEAGGHACLRDPERLEEARAFVERVKAGVEPPPAPSRALVLEEYIEGGANEAAVHAARAVCAEPGRRYNPLFLAGSSGTGKTHLLHAIGNRIAAQQGVVVACLSAQAFTEELVAALNAGRVEWWRRRYRRADAVLLDDVQLLAGRERTQEELFNLFNEFTEADKQLAFTADRAPARLLGFAARLITRFEGGLVAELAAPDRSMRATMVRRLLAARGASADDDVVEYLAARPADSARAVQGLVNRALARMDLSSDVLGLETARLAVEGRAPRPSQRQAISAVVPAGLDPTVGSREKMVWDWPHVGDRLIEELR
jgi:chromosomal replication initiator protein